MDIKLDIEFKDAFKKISDTEKEIPSDILLRLYAYYKQAQKGDTFGSVETNNELDLKNAFKYNARMQLKGMDSKEAKEEYIKLVNEILNK